MFPSLPTRSARANPRRRICVVTPDIAGPVSGGGIGTAYRHLVVALARDGHDVTVLYTLGERSDRGTIGDWISFYAAQGAVFVPMPAPEQSVTGGPLGQMTADAYAVDEWLRRQDDFDIVHSPEWRASCYYALTAKQAGLRYGSVHFCIGVHSPSMWNIAGNGALPNRLSSLVFSYMERKCVEMADTVVSPSQYMFGWLETHGCRLPEGKCFVQPNLFTVPAALQPTEVQPPTSGRLAVSEFVFFGRLDPRKGLIIFCDALKRLFEEQDALPTVTFVGRPSTHFDSKRYVEGYFAHSGMQFEWKADLDSAAALAYLQQPGRLAVLPSLIDNAPYTLLECLRGKVPLIASAVGGIPELIHPDDREDVMFAPHPVPLAEMLQRVSRIGARVPRASFDEADNAAAWLQWHRGADDARPASEVRDVGRLPERVVVCLTHYERPAELRQAIASLDLQDHPDIEIVLVDDGSRSSDARALLEALRTGAAPARWPLKVVLQDNRYPGAARNLAAAQSDAPLIMFMDDDNVAKPEEVSTLVAVRRRTDAGVVTCFRESFVGSAYPSEGDGIACYTSLGDCLTAGLFMNCFGDANCLVTREAFQLVGGFSEDYGVGNEDWEFLARLVVRGVKLVVAPEKLFWYRESAARLRHLHLDNLPGGRRSMGAWRVIRPYAELLGPEFVDILSFARGLDMEQTETSTLLGRAQADLPRLHEAATKLAMLLKG